MGGVKKPQDFHLLNVIKYPILSPPRINNISFYLGNECESAFVSLSSKRNEHSEC